MENDKNYKYAFINQHGIVLSVLLFSEHDENLLNQVKDSFNFSDYKLCSEFETAYVGGEFYNNKFYPIKLYESWIRNEELGTWEAPIPYPAVEEGSDEIYTWDEPTTSWLLLPPSN